MRTTIKKLQGKPEHIRKQILVGFMAVSMLVVGTVWIYGLTDHPSTPTVADNTTSSNPFSLLRDSISSAYQNVTASVGSVSFGAKKEDAPTQKQINLIPVEHTN